MSEQPKQPVGTASHRRPRGAATPKKKKKTISVNRAIEGKDKSVSQSRSVKQRASEIVTLSMGT